MSDEYYFELICNDSSESNAKLEVFFANNRESILSNPNRYFIKPFISENYPCDHALKAFLNAIVKFGIDLNSTEYYAGRNDFLADSDMIYGWVMFSVAYVVKSKRRSLSTLEVSILIRLIKNSYLLGWDCENQTKKKAIDYLYSNITQGHSELTELYDYIISLKKETKSFQEVFYSVDDDSDDAIQVDDNSVDIVYESSRSNHLIRLIKSIGVNNSIDTSSLSNPYLFKRIEREKEVAGFVRVDDYLSKEGITTGTIDRIPIYSETTDEYYEVPDVLDAPIDGFSNRTYNRLKRYKINTYNDLLNMSIDGFSKVPGVGVTVLSEVQDRINQIRNSLKNETSNEENQKGESRDEEVVTLPSNIETINSTTFSVGDSITHKKLGNAVVSKIEGKRLYAYFGNRELVFVIPEAVDQGFIWKNENKESMYSKLCDYCANTKMLYSYKAVLLIAFFELADSNGKVNIVSLIKYFRDFYDKRKSSGMLVEKANSIYLTDATDAQIRINIIQNPIRAVASSDFFSYDYVTDTMSIKDDLWKAIGDAEKKKLIQICHERLTAYYIEIDGE